MRNALPAMALGALTLAVVFWVRSTGDEAGPGPMGIRVGRALHLAGSPREKGRAHGRLLRAEIHALLDRLKPADPGSAEFAVHTCAERILPTLPEHIRAEIEGVAEGAGIDPHEALFLNARHELAGHGLANAAEATDLVAAVSARGPAAVRQLAEPDVFVFVHEDADPKLVLVGYPGMVGGLMGVCGPTAAVLRPVPSQSLPLLSSPPWPVLLRRLLEAPPTPGGSLPTAPTMSASVALARPDGEVGTLCISPAGATWYAGLEGFAMAADEPVLSLQGRIGLGRRTAADRLESGRAARALMIDPPAGCVRLTASPYGVELAIGDVRHVVRFAR